MHLRVGVVVLGVAVGLLRAVELVIGARLGREGRHLAVEVNGVVVLDGRPEQVSPVLFWGGRIKRYMVREEEGLICKSITQQSMDLPTNHEVARRERHLRLEGWMQVWYRNA
jgi:hypothetical protein